MGRKIRTRAFMAEKGYIDEIITPEQTRPKLIRALELLQTKKEKMPPQKNDNLQKTLNL